MEKIKSLLNPGHSKDDDVLYGSGQRSGNDGAANTTQTSDVTPSAVRGEDPSYTSGQGADTTSGLGETKPYQGTTTAGDSTVGQAVTTSGDTKYDPSTATATQGKEEYLPLTPAVDEQTTSSDVAAGTRDPRPNFSEAGSAISTASIKSNVIGRAPTGSSLTADETTGTTGRAYGAETSDLNNPAGYDGSTQAIGAGGASATANPLSDGSSQAIGTSTSTSTEGKEYNTVLGSKLDPNQSMNPHTMPGAFPLSPIEEADKNLDGGDSTGGKNTALLAAQSAFMRSDPSTGRSAPPALEPKASPYTSTLDPRVDGSSARPTEQSSSSKAPAAAAAAAAAAAVGGGSYAASQRQTATDGLPQNQQTSSTPSRLAAGTLRPEGKQTQQSTAKTSALAERTKDTDEKEHHQGRNAALAAATGAAGYGAYKASDRTEDKPVAKNQPVTSTSGQAPLSSTGESVAIVSEPVVEREFPLAGGSTSVPPASSTTLPQTTSTSDYGNTPIMTTTNTRHMSSGENTYVPHRETTSQDVAENGAAGAGAASAYSALQHREADQPKASSVDLDAAAASYMSSKAVGGYDDQRAAPTSTLTEGGSSVAPSSTIAQKSSAEPSAIGTTGTTSSSTGDSTLVIGSPEYYQKIGAPAEKPAPDSTVVYGTPEYYQQIGSQPAVPASTTQQTTGTTEPTSNDDNRFGSREAAIAGAGAGAGAVLIGSHAYNSKKDTDSALGTDSTQYQPATGPISGERQAAVAYGTDSTGDKLEHEREKVAEARHEKHEHKLRKSEDKQRKSVDKERRKSEAGSEEKKKHGLLHKILHPREHKREKEEAERAGRTSSDEERSGHGKTAAAATGAGLVGGAAAYKAAEGDKDRDLASSSDYTSTTGTAGNTGAIGTTDTAGTTGVTGTTGTASAIGTTDTTSTTGPVGTTGPTGTTGTSTAPLAGDIGADSNRPSAAATSYPATTTAQSNVADTGAGPQVGDAARSKVPPHEDDNEVKGIPAPGEEPTWTFDKVADAPVSYREEDPMSEKVRASLDEGRPVDVGESYGGGSLEGAERGGGVPKADVKDLGRNRLHKDPPAGYGS